MTTRWGFLATGRIAHTVAKDLALVDGAVPFAVGSREAARAEAFAAEHGFERAYGSYEDLLADDEVDVVYVATPHGQHHRVVSAALQAGKPVLVEKAFTVSHAAAVDLVTQARDRDLFLMEAMWTRFLPVIMQLRHLVADGAIGDVRAVDADLGFRVPVDPANRLWAPELGGGAVLDLGVYPVSFAQMLLGPPASVAVTGSLGRTGVDADVGMLLGWPDGAHARLGCSLTSFVEGRALVTGTHGRIEVPTPFHHPPHLVLHREGHDREVVDAPVTGRGYSHQLVEVQRCLAEGITESPVMPLEDTLAVMATLETALVALGSGPVDEGWR
ncbi:MAG: Gfo/Idh/MocA family protein [Actinomycetes bacterium]